MICTVLLTFGTGRSSVSRFAFTNIGLDAFSVVAVLRADWNTACTVGAPRITFATNLHRSPFGNHLEIKSRKRKLKNNLITPLYNLCILKAALSNLSFLLSNKEQSFHLVILFFPIRTRRHHTIIRGREKFIHCTLIK